MSRPLILSYYFPPIGGAGAQRPARFVRYLPMYGYSPAVVTGPGETRGRWTPLDESLAREIADGVEVRRARGEPLPSSKWQGRGERWFGLESPWKRWWIRESVAQGLEVDGVDAVYTVMSPYWSAEAAFQLGRELEKPWIADLGDPWALDEMVMYPSAWHRRRELQRMRRLLGTAAAIVMTTPEAARRIRQEFPELADRPVVSIPCGFDSSDFAGPAPERSDGAFRIVHTGYLHTELGHQQRGLSRVRRLVGGGVGGVDILTRSHVCLLEAVGRLIARDPSLRSRIEILLAGVLSADDRREAERSPVVRTLGYLSHAESIGLMRSADLLFLPMQNLPPGTRSGTVPGKTYEYLASQRPILAAVPEGDARDILLQSGTAHVCAPDDVEAMASTIEAELQRRRSGRPAPEVPRALLAQFERRSLVAEYAAVLGLVVGEEASATSTSRALFAA